MSIKPRWAVMLLGMLLAARALGDAIITSQAMFATTIAEFYLQPGEVRVELEIGLQDLHAFRNLMPDAIYEEMGNSPRPYRERLAEFFANDLVIATETGALPGRLLEIGPRDRVLRDPITGEELPVAEGQAGHSRVPLTMTIRRSEPCCQTA